MKMKAWR